MIGWRAAERATNCASCGGAIRRGERVFVVSALVYAGNCALRAEARSKSYR